MKPEWEKYILPGILLLALLLRLRFLGFLYPYFEFNDEVDLVASALNILRTGDFNPHFFFYGSFPIYWTTGLFLAVLCPYWLFSGSGVSFHLFLTSLDYHWQGMFLFYLGRLTSVGFGVGSVYLIYRAGRELSGEKTGRLAALFLALCPFHIYFSQLFKVDASFLFWFLLVIIFSLRVYRQGRIRDYFLSGLFLGLVLSTRYNFLAGLPILLAGLSREGWRGLLRPGLWVSVYTAAAVFFLTSPYALLDFPEFLRQMKLQMAVDQQGVTFFRTDPSRLLYQRYLSQLVFLFPAFFGPLLYPAAFAGAARLWRSDRRLFLILVSCPVVFFAAFSGYSELVMPQYQVPFLPFIFLLGAEPVAALIGAGAGRARKAGGLVLCFSLVFFLSDLAVPHFKEIYYVYRDAGRWAEKNIPRESRVLAYTWVYSLNPGGREKLTQIRQASGFKYRDFEAQDPDFLILADNAALKGERFRDLYREYRRLADGLEQGDLREKYRLVRSFRPGPVWEFLAGIAYPELKGFRISVFAKGERSPGTGKDGS